MTSACSATQTACVPSDRLSSAVGEGTSVTREGTARTRAEAAANVRTLCTCTLQLPAGASRGFGLRPITCNRKTVRCLRWRPIFAGECQLQGPETRAQPLLACRPQVVPGLREGSACHGIQKPCLTLFAASQVLRRRRLRHGVESLSAHEYNTAAHFGL